MIRLLGRWAGRGLAGWIAWRIFGPELTPRFRGRQSRPLRIPGRTVFVGDKELFVRETGVEDGPPIVLVHGWSFDGEMTYHRLIPELAARYRVVVPDHRNHGKSDRIRARYDLDALADELAGVLRAIGISRATVMGYSMGGMVSLLLADRHPDLVGRLVLAATAARPIASRRTVTRLSFWLGRALARLSGREASALTTRLLVHIGAIEPAHARWMWEALMDRDATLHYEAGGAVWRFDARAVAPRIDVPTLVVVTAADRLVPPATQRELAGLLKEAQVVELDDAGHDAILSRPEEFAKAIHGFAS